MNDSVEAPVLEAPKDNSKEILTVDSNATVENDTNEVEVIFFS